jgi:hypothetical protein
MDAEEQVMSLRFIGGLSVARRVALATAVTAVTASFGLTPPAAAQERVNVTAQLRGGERVAGRFDGFTNGLIYVDVSDTDERKIPVGDVALIDVVGGAQGLPETELREARGDDHLLLLKSGSSVKGRLVSIDGAPSTVVFRTTSGEERRVPLSEVGRLYLGRYPGGGAGPAATPPPTAGATTPGGPVTVNANQQWVSTGITVSRGQQVSFDSSGEVQLSPDGSDVATTGGSKLGRRLTGGPLPGQLAGALVGRVGSGRAFGIGNQAGALQMPDDGLLYLGVNDDNVADNQGAFTVTVTPQPGTTRSNTPPRPGRIRRP